MPIYFNINDLHIFEPDKAILLRDLAAILSVLALARLTLTALTMARRPEPGVARAHADTPGRHGAAGWSRDALIRGAVLRPTLLPLMLLSGVTLLASATSILPALSWQGSYARGQGALTTLAYFTMALLVIGLIRRPAQAQRLIAAIALSGVIPAAYGWVQHFGRDPLPWQQPDLAARVPGTLGNPIFLGALLVMTLPLALYRLILAASTVKSGNGHALVPGVNRRAMIAPQHVCMLGWAAVVGVEAGGLFFTKSRGPFAGLLVALVVFGLGLARAWNLRRLRQGSVALSIVAIAIIASSNLLGGGALRGIQENSALRLLRWTPRSSGSSEVRLLIWRPALTLIARRPLLGCGPDALQYCYYPVYPTALRHVEAPNAVPDRTHDILLDAATETGLLGLVALLSLLGVTARILSRLSAGTTDPTQRALAAALLATLVGHVAEGLFGIAIVATTLLTWLIAGLAGALAAMETPAFLTHGRPSADRSKPARRRHWLPVPAGAALLPALAALSLASAALPAQSAPSSRPMRPCGRSVGKDRNKRAERRARTDTCRSARLVVVLAAGGCIAMSIIAWQVIACGVTATAADVAARQASDLEAVALGNSGQAPLPQGRRVQPILALRQFSAATSDLDTAMRLMPDQEDYLLDAGRTLVEWAYAAGDVGGPAAAQAPTLYARGLVAFGRAARLNPYDPDPLRDTGKAYERWAGLGHDPTGASTWNQGLLARATQAFARAAQLAPHHPDPLTSWAQVALWQGRPQQAFALSNRALALDARDGDGYRLRGEAEIALGARQAALADWRRALADPSAAQHGPTAAHLALAEATWDHARCDAVHDARSALSTVDLQARDAAQMDEIVHVDGPRCSSR